MSDGVTLITCTGGRSEAFNLCREFVARQTWAGKMQWIVVDDFDCVESYKALSDLRRLGWPTVIRPKPFWQSGQNTLARNILAAIPEIRHDKILFIEDDDWYAPDYVDVMASLLEDCELLGECESYYYHIPSHQYQPQNNRKHASLCQTGLRRSLLGDLEKVCKSGSRVFLDIQLWENVPNHKHGLWPGRRCLGIKGLPGRKGIGNGHLPFKYSDDWKPDPEGKFLREWIGSDVKLYEKFFDKEVAA